jgi:transcriptional regulator with XRE-family HTH domain
VATYTQEGLGRAVRSLREAAGLTQEQLGSQAGYGTGAGVSISRLENGLLKPTATKLEGIAKALGVAVSQLEDLAGGHSDGPQGPDTRGSRSGSDARIPSAKELKARAKKVQQEADARAMAVATLAETFNEQHDRARDEFFMRFVETANLIEGAPQVDHTQLEDESSEADATAVAAFRLGSNASGLQQVLVGGVGGAAVGSAVGGAAAYGTFVAVASFGTASTGAAISGLSGIAATNATLAALGGGTLAAGGAGVAGGTMVLAGIVAAPALILAAGGLIWMAKRNRRQQLEFAAKLDEAEAELEATRPGVEALEAILPQATEALDYIATHAGHALTRWEQRLGSATRSWESLPAEDQLQYQDFIDIAAAQLTIVTMNVQGILTTRGDDQQDLIDLANQVVAQSRNVITARV